MTLSIERYTYTDKKATRDGFGQALLDLGAERPEVVALCADLTGSLKMNHFEAAYPDRFLQMGISEANMMSVAAGLTLSGKIPYTGTFANFSTGRVYDQIRQSIAYSHKNVKICASHAGLTLGEDGATHQILEDIGLMRMLPGMTVINPCDYRQTMWATKGIADIDGPVYLRFGRPGWPVFMPEDAPFEVGKGYQMTEGSDVTLIATGHMVWQCVEAAKTLEQQGIHVELINIHTIKPIDTELIVASAAKTGHVVTAEEHNVLGGLGSAVAEVLAQYQPTPMEMVGTKDTFGESGTPAQLLEKYGLAPKDLVAAVQRVLKR